MTLKIRRIDCASDDAERAIAALRAELSPRGNVVSPEGRARTVAAFGEPLEPWQVAARICDDVAARGLEAVLDYGRRLDGVELDPGRIRVSEEELEDAHRQADPAYLETIARVRANILAYQRAILHRDVRLSDGTGIELGLLLPAAAAGGRLRTRWGRGLSVEPADDRRPRAGRGSGARSP